MAVKMRSYRSAAWKEDAPKGYKGVKIADIRIMLDGRKIIFSVFKPRNRKIPCSSREIGFLGQEGLDSLLLQERVRRMFIREEDREFPLPRAWEDLIMSWCHENDIPLGFVRQFLS